MRIVYFTHSLVSCWNHGNVHFQRGLLTALRGMGHQVLAAEPALSWSRENMLRTNPDAQQAFGAAWPELAAHQYNGAGAIEHLVDGADLVVVHEWNEPDVVAAVGRLRRRQRFTLLFHDTHHRAVSEPDAVRRFDLRDYDGVLAFGEALAAVYRRWGWGERVFTWHEAADTSRFRPPAEPGARAGAVWIGNWGDGERTAELQEFLLRPAAASGTALDIHGVRYPDAARAVLRKCGARYHGWLANGAVPAVFARHTFTVHVPRRFYAGALPGIPTIRVFEALACGIPLLSAPWSDSEGLFRLGEDFLLARNGDEMAGLMRMLRAEPASAAALAASGLARIEARHTCRHRAAELVDIVARLVDAKVAV